MKRILTKKPLKSVIILLVSYALLVVLFESSLGYFQPESASTLQITTVDADGAVNQRILARLESTGQLYVAANHWPRAWYREALANSSVQVSLESERGSYIAVPVEGAEHDSVNADNPLGLMFRILTGFPPRYFLRLDRAD
ncbi:MAG: hypothetical protein COB20_02430 [SAR86 cluster bacterium]|uniref:DUF385 domain-containing protein n=1 Tax=SAR86 cluster bacterium TaxID=2030880 RepID=A0A2A4XFB4_9GAMM|nr:MAG: hypothetical protein COB20_02430 [SAR86 cluster bacterium]